MRINTNIASMTAQEAATNTTKNISSSLEKLGSGLAINKAADDASGLSIADKLRTQASSLGQGINNANSASALIQIADKAMSEQSNILDIVKTKLIQASTSTTSTEGRESIRKDISKLLEQFDAIASQTNYNGTTLLQKSSTDTAKQDDLSFQLGESDSFDVTMVQSKASNTTALGGGGDTFGAIQGNSSVTIANVNTMNAIGGTQLLDGKVTDNNIAIDGAQQLNTTGVVTIASVSISSQGTESADGSMDITLAGKLGTVDSTNSIDFDASSESSEVITALKTIADNNVSVTFNTTTNVLQVNNGSVDFGDLEFSALNATSSNTTTPDFEDIAINVGGQTAANGPLTYTVTNNVSANRAAGTGDQNPLLGQLNVHTNSTVSLLTGGSLMSELKDLDSGQLTAAKANQFMSTVDEAMSQLNANRSDFGSTQNQLESSIRNMQTTQTNLKAAESVIRDVDYASESANFNKQNIIAQAGTYAMSQANAMQQNVMRLLQ